MPDLELVHSQAQFVDQALAFFGRAGLFEVRLRTGDQPLKALGFFGCELQFTNLGAQALRRRLGWTAVRTAAGASPASAPLRPEPGIPAGFQPG